MPLLQGHVSLFFVRYHDSTHTTYTPPISMHVKMESSAIHQSLIREHLHGHVILSKERDHHVDVGRKEHRKYITKFLRRKSHDLLR